MPDSTTDNPYERLRAAILGFDLVPGEKLSERTLETRLGTSRTPIRAALLRLQNDGLMLRVGRGWQVAPIDMSEVRSVMEFRESIEAGVILRVIERGSDEDLAALRVMVESRRNSDDEETGLRDGGDFHASLARLTGNPFYVSAMDDILTRLSRTRRLGVRTVESRASARDEHLKIIDAVRLRDRELALRLVSEHGYATRDRLLEYLDAERLRLRGRGFSIVESANSAPVLRDL